MDLSDTKVHVGQIEIVKGNEPLLLDDPGTCWILQSGSVALFATAVSKGTPEGVRSYLCMVHPGEAVFGGLARSDDEPRALLAVAIEEAAFLKLSPPHLRERFASHHDELIELVESWVAKLSAVFAHESLDSMPLQVVGEQKYALSPGERIEPKPKTVVWLHLIKGEVTWMGRTDLPLGPTTALFPLGSGLWLEAREAVELETLETAAISDLDALCASLSELLTQFLCYSALLEQQTTQEAFQEFLEEDRLNQQRQSETLENLASILQSSQVPAPTSEGSPLWVAARAVGDVLGIPIRPPAKSDDPARSKAPLEGIAHASHIRTRVVLLEDAWWKHDNGPLLAFSQEDKHPVALLPLTATRYELFDPASMTRTPMTARLASTLSPLAYTFYRPFPNSIHQALSLLKFGLQGYHKELLVMFLTAMAVTLLGMLTPQMFAVLIDRAIPDADREILFQIGLALLAAAFGQTLFQLAQGFALLRFQTGSGHATQAAMWDRLLNLKPSFFRQFAVGDLQFRVTAISTIREKLSGTTINTVLTGFLAFLNLGLMYVYSPKLALVAAVVALIVIVVTTYSGYLTVLQMRALQPLIGDLFGTTVQLINGVTKLRVAGAEGRAFAYWGEKFGRQQRLQRRTQQIEDSIKVFNGALPMLASAVIFWFVSLDIQSASDQTALTAGTFLAFNAAYGFFISGATTLSNTLIDLLEVSTLFERARPILEGMPEVDDNKTDPGRLEGKLSLEHVTFRYQEDSAAILENVTIHAEPGEFIALVGPSGCGKSTLLRLLLGFETPEAGTVYYDDQDLARLDIYAVRRQLGIVLQNSRISAGSMFENIAGTGFITLDEAWDAARAAGLADDITDMPMGMHTYLSEGGSTLSGGQRQRLLIARALALKPKIMLFDEATSALDNRTQAIVSESLDKMRATRVVIAHRLSTIQNADRIYVLEGGQIIQQGSFDELAAQEGLFAQLIARQTL